MNIYKNIYKKVLSFDFDLVTISERNTDSNCHPEVFYEQGVLKNLQNLQESQSQRFFF